MKTPECHVCGLPRRLCICPKPHRRPVPPANLDRLVRAIRARRLPPPDSKQIAEMTDEEFETFLLPPKYVMINEYDVVRLLADHDEYPEGTLATVMCLHDYGQYLTLEVLGAKDISGILNVKRSEVELVEKPDHQA